MPRRKRLVIPNRPHHVTQRGGRRQNVFFTDEDRQFYLKLLEENSERYGVQVIAYCLMSNHVHHLLVPLESDSLRWTLQLTHKRYADFINSKKGWSGHLWQQRYYSSPVDDEFFWITLRYIERNPVEAGIVEHAADYHWSSAIAHCKQRTDSLLTKDTRWEEMVKSKSDWSEWLESSDSEHDLLLLKNRTNRDLPTGSDQFLQEIEREYGVSPYPPKLGRPKKGKVVTVT